MAILLFTGLCAGLLYLLQGWLYEYFWGKNLSADVVFTERAITEGEVGRIQETIVNAKLLPLPMIRVKFEIDRSLQFEEEINSSISDKCYKNDIFSIMLYQKITRTIPFRGTKRGYYSIDQMDLVSTDLFMTATLVDIRSIHTRLFVYPRGVDTKRLLIPYRKMMGTLLTRRYAYEDPFEFRGIRAYQPFDGIKDVNWKASAKTGELKVNIHDYTARQEVCLLLNLETEAMLEYEILKEESIRIVNSLAEWFLSQGISVGLLSNGRDIETKEELRMVSGSGRNHIDMIREQLARLDLSQTCREYGDVLAEQQLSTNGENILYILVSTSQRVKVQREFNQICKNRKGSMWILPLYSDMEERLTDCPLAESYRWEVGHG